MDPALDMARTPARPPALDWAIAGALVLWAVLEQGLMEHAGSPAERIAFGVAWSAPIVLRRRAPVAILAWVLAVAVLHAVLHAEVQQGSMPFPVILVAVFSAGLHVAGRLRTATALACALVAFPVVDVLQHRGFDGVVLASYFILPFFVAGAWTAGRLVRRRAMALAAEQQRGGVRAREAVLEERARIARELHDVVAHSVSIVVVQAGAADALLEHDPPRAREHLAAVRRTAQEALVEMRRLTDVLREHDGSLEPQPGLERVDQLVAEARAAGQPVELETDGERGLLPPGVDLAAYRIVQEALTNARKYAPGAPTRVRVSYRPDAIALEVADEGAGPADGHPANGGLGLPGMRERARVYGGTVEAAARQDGGFVVRADLPREGRPA